MELQRLHYAVIQSQQLMLLCASLAISQRLLLQSQVDRSLWIKRRSTAFIEESSLAGITRSSKAISTSVVRHICTFYLPIDRFIPVGPTC